MTIRAKFLLALILGLASLLRADFLFWLDAPTRRDNPRDPKAWNYQTQDPLAAPTSTAVLPSGSPSASPTRSATPTVGGSASSTPSATQALTAPPGSSATPTATQTWFDSTPTASRTPGSGASHSPTPTQTWFDSTPTASRTPGSGASSTPTASPSAGATTPSATPTAAAPGSVMILVQSCGGVPVADAWVQIGDDSVGAQQTDMGGAAFFSSVSMPYDVYVFSPDSGGAALYSPTIAAVWRASFSTLTIYVSLKSQPAGICDPSWLTLAFDGTPPGSRYEYGVVFEPSSLENVGNYPGAPAPYPSVGFAPDQDYRYLAWQLDAAGATVAAAIAMGSVHSSLTITGTLDAGTVQLANWKLSATPGWQSYHYKTYTGMAADELFLTTRGLTVFSSTMQAYTTASTPSPLLYRVRCSAADYVAWMGDPFAPYYNVTGHAEFSDLSGSQNVALPARMTVSKLPTAADLSLSATNTSGLAADTWVIGLADPDHDLSGWVPGCPAGDTFSFTLPSTYPAGVPASYHFQAGMPSLYSVMASKLKNAPDPADSNTYSGGLNPMGDLSNYGRQGTW